MKAELLSLLLPVLVFGCACIAFGEPNSGSVTPSEARDLRWQEDLDYFAAELPARHWRFHKLISKSKFHEEVTQLRDALPRLSDSEIALRLTRMVAGLGVAHTRVELPPGELAFQYYPVRFMWFSDGLAVVGAAPEYREAIGARVVRIGSRTPDEVEALVSDYIAHENEFGLRHESPGFMAIQELLNTLNVADSNRLKLTLVKGNQEPFTLEIAGTVPSWEWNRIAILDAPDVPRSLRRGKSTAFYWHEYLPDSRALYVQYRSCQNAPEKPFAAYVDELFALADTNSVQRFVLDLRDNGGGDAAVIKPLVSALKSHPALTKKGNLYVLIGPGTASSGLWAALDFRKHFRAILVGEPTGAKPNGYGDVRTLTLPNSRLGIRYSTQYFRLIRFTDPVSLKPDVPVGCTLDDFLAGRDRALEAALSLPRKGTH